MTEQDVAGTIGILGAGWLGLPLARTLLAAGKQVAVTVSSAQKAAQLTAEGLQAWPLQLGTGLTALPFRCCELVICVPPSKVEDYPAAIGRVAELAQAAGVQRLLFVSATSVWAPGQGEDEHPMPAHERGMRMLAAEQAAVAEETQLQALLVREKVEAARRAMLLYPQQMSWNWWDDVTVELRFWLPAGSFATSVVRELINTTGDYANIAE